MTPPKLSPKARENLETKRDKDRHDVATSYTHKLLGEGKGS